MKTWIVLIAATILLTGCVSTATHTIDAQALSGVRNQTVVHTVRDMPDFSEMTPAKVTFGMIGSAFMISEGNKTVAANRIADPAVAIAGGMLDAMRAAHGMQVGTAPVRIDSEDPARIAALAKGKARYVLDVRTLVWMMMYFPTDWTHYQVLYTAKARLIDVDAKSVIAEAFCKQQPESSNNAPTFDEMLALNATRLKAINAANAQACASSFGRDMLALTGSVRMPSATLAIAAPGLASVPTPTPVPVPAPEPAPVPVQVSAPLQAGMPDWPEASADGDWHGVMRCGARGDRGAYTDAYEARFEVEIHDGMVSVHRRTAVVEESLAGLAANGRLELQGTGHRLAEPARSWQLKVRGDFPLGTTSFQGEGIMSAGGRRLRTCVLNLVRA